MLWAAVAVAMTVSAHEPRVFCPEGAQVPYLRSSAPIRVWSSRVGRGKTFGGCLSEHAKCLALPGMVSAVTRLERVSMENTTLVTLRDEIVGPELWAYGWSESKSVLTYPRVRCSDGVVRQSRMHVFGWNDPGRSLSANFGSIMVDQAEQLERRHYTVAQTRLRQNDPWINAEAERQGLAARQLSLICNPEDDEHWIAKEFNPDGGRGVRYDAEGRVAFEVFLSEFNDNAAHLPPDYHARLESLKGTVWYDRLVLGKWARAEGSVFTMWDPARHVVEAPWQWREWDGYPPPTWPRYRGIDFGYRNPFVCLWLAQSPDGALYVYRQYGVSERLVEDHARRILELESRELHALRQSPYLHSSHEGAADMAPYLDNLNLRGSYADHDAEDAATLARYGVRTSPARKDIDGCVQAIATALNRGTLYVVRGSVVERDEFAERDQRPDSLEREMSALKWARPIESRNPKDDAKERIEDRNNHRVDALGYVLYTLNATRRPAVIG